MYDSLLALFVSQALVFSDGQGWFEGKEQSGKREKSFSSEGADS